MSQQLIDAAKAPSIAYGEKNWNAVKAALTPGFRYEEIATQRMAEGADNVVTLWQGWAAAFPDSKPTFREAWVSGNTVVLELNWRGTHKGPLQTPKGSAAATGKSIDIRACQVLEIADGKVRWMRQYFDMATMYQQLGISG